MDQEILQRYIEGNSTTEEKEAIARWLDADEKNMKEFLLLRSIYDATLWNDKNSFSHTNIILNPNADGRNKKRKITSVIEFLKIASVFLLAFGCYYLFLSEKTTRIVTKMPIQSIYAPEGQRAEVVLSDGTKVWLNAKSKLYFPDRFEKEERIVELDGEAYFDVAHDENKQFIVKTKIHHIKVYGTEFNVKAYNNSNIFETSLIKGSVEVFSICTNQSVLLLPGTKVYLKNNDLISCSIENHDQFLWKEGILFFENEIAEDILERLELYYDVNIEVRNKELLTNRYTGKFRTKDGIDHILKVLQLYHNFAYTKDEMNNIIIE